jgi:hypothetical protein
MFHKNVAVKAHFDWNSIEMSDLIGGFSFTWANGIGAHY